MHKLGETYASQIKWIEQKESRYLDAIDLKGISDTKRKRHVEYSANNTRLGHSYVL